MSANSQRPVETPRPNTVAKSDRVNEHKPEEQLLTHKGGHDV